MIFADLNLDEEIATVGLRISQRKRRIATEVDGVASALRDNVTSPTALLLAIAVGFALGRMTDGKVFPHQARAGRLLSILEGVRVALQVIRAPTLVWVTRLLGIRHSAAGASAARPQRQSPQSYPR